MTRGLVVAAMMMAVAACAGPVPTSAQDKLNDALLTPSSLGKNLTLSQLVVGEFQDQKHSFHVEVEVMPSRMAVVGLTPVGVPLFTLELEGGEIFVETLGAEQFPFDPRHMLSDIQIAHWPEAALREKFQAHGLILRAAAAQNMREVLSEDGTLLVAVTYAGAGGPDGDMVIEHFEPSYLLRINALNELGGE